MSPQNSSSARWVELDGVRGLAALLVVYAHLFLGWMPAAPSPVFWLRTLSGMAWTGVDLFFVLSGFLIGGILLRHRDAVNYYAVFFGRRAARILPLYGMLLVVVWGVRHWCAVGENEGFVRGDVPFWPYVLLVQNFPMAWTGGWGVGSLGVTWSVATEAQFYVLVALLVRLVPRCAYFLVFAVVAAMGPVFRFLLPVAAPVFLLPGVLEPFFAGVMVAWLFLYRPLVFMERGWRWGAAGLFAAGGVCMGWMAVWGGFGAFRETGITLFWGAFLWLVLAFRGGKWMAALRWRPLCWVGGISYGVYLLHPLIVYWIFLDVIGTLPERSMGWAGFGLTWVVLGVVFAVAWVSAHFFEEPVTALGRRLRFRKLGKAGEEEAYALDLAARSGFDEPRDETGLHA